ncbi:MAG TPA: ice-binding family protein [Candidatus Limnocylindria bacterium]
MNNSRAIVATIGLAFVIAIGAMAGTAANAANPPVGLGSAATYSVLAGTPSITNTGATTIDRDVGIHPADSIIGFPPGIIGGTVHAGDAVALQAKSDLTVAYLDAAGRPVTANHSALGGLTLVGGVYNANGATLGLTGTLTLNGQNDPNSVWIFQATSDLVTASTSSVVFINGGSPCNVFWQVTTSATLGSGSHFVGTILALDSITLANGVTVNGRALARNGLVSLINDTFITSTCNAAPPVVVPPGTRPPFTPAPTATPVAPAATPIATAASSVTPTTAPVAAVPTVKPAAVAGTQRLPSTSTNDPAGPLTMLGIALTGIGILLLRGRSIRHL